jgi:hypothetical protein
MLSVAKHPLFLVENKQKQILRRRSAQTRRGTILESITCSNTTRVEFLPIMGSRKAVNAQDDSDCCFFISQLDFGLNEAVSDQPSAKFGVTVSAGG